MDEVEFTITDEALDFIVDKALEYKLCSWITFVMWSYLNRCDVRITKFDDKTLVIDEEYAQETLNKNLLKRLEIAS
jgi:ATP-dependent Clp protease ATP-binding subunit ClpX